MRILIWSHLSKVLLVLMIPVLAACAADAVPDRYYLLSPLGGQSGGAAPNAPVVGIGPVTIPSYLDRSAIVTRSAENRPKVNLGHRWAEPLGENINRVIMDNLDQSGRVSRLEMFPWTSRDGVRWQVVVDIDKFERQPDGQVVLSARWKLISFEQGNIASADRYVGFDQPGDASIESTVVAMSNLLAGLSADITRSIP